MGRTRTPGLRQRNGIWHIDKQIKGYGILRESTGSRSLEEAEAYLARRREEIRRATVYGVRPTRSFRQAATKYLLENKHLASIGDSALHLKQLDAYIGDIRLDRIHDGTLRPFVEARKEAGIKNKSVNLALEVVRRILSLAARSWRDEYGLTWLETMPLITMLPLTDARSPYPLSWDEQRIFFDELPAHLQAMALFKVNTGTREQEVCQLRWEWEMEVPELNTSVFLIPKEFVKNREDRLVVLNQVAKSVVEAQRVIHPRYVFTYKGEHTNVINAGAWRAARTRAAQIYEQKFGEAAPDGFANVRVHDLKHTFGRRLRAAGVPLETRKVLLGHTNGDITSHYSAPELAELLEAANKVCSGNSVKNPSLTLIKRKTG